MNHVEYEDFFRVTSIPFSSKNIVIFSGVPLNKGSYKKIVVNITLLSK